MNIPLTYSCLLSGLLCVSMASTSVAQAPQLPIGYPASEPHHYHHASTFEQGYLDGQARVVRSYGQAAYNLSLAARHAQAAREHALHNSVVQVDTYFARHFRNDYYRALKRPIVTQDVIQRINASRLPDRLSERQFDAHSSTIFWPAALRNSTFAADRQALELLFDSRSANNSGRGSTNQVQVKKVVRRMRDQLRTYVRAMDVDQYLAACNFLDSLKYEAYFAV